ncbi:hypothetical protein [Agromyces subbeticus]|nr:hypothetical protein [Agromyces subbeticus]
MSRVAFAPDCFEGTVSAADAAATLRRAGARLAEEWSRLGATVSSS